EYEKKTGLPLGRVLVMLRIVTDQNLQDVLHVQNLMKFEELPLALATKALSTAHEKNVPIDSALKMIGWVKDKFKGVEPAELQKLRQLLFQTEESLGPNHPDNADVLMQLGEFYSDNEMWPHAEGHYHKALANLEKHYGPAHLAVAGALWRLG